MSVPKVPKSSKASGNTKQKPKQISPSKHWCFTFNNYTIDDIAVLSSTFKQICSNYVFQEEKGDCGTPHLQGYCHFKNKIRPLSLELPKTIHWEKKKGTVKQCIAYCTKDESRNGQIYTNIKSIGYKIKTIDLEKFYPWQKEVSDTIIGEDEDRKIYWIYDKVGNKGKSAFVKYNCVHKDALLLSGKAADMKYAIHTMVRQKNYPELIFIDIPRSSNKFLSYAGIEEIKNGCFFSGKYEAGMVLFNSPKIIIFSNALPRVDTMSKDRWQVHEITDDKKLSQPKSIEWLESNLDVDAKLCDHLLDSGVDADE